MDGQSYKKRRCVYVKRLFAYVLCFNIHIQMTYTDRPAKQDNCTLNTHKFRVSSHEIAAENIILPP